MHRSRSSSALSLYVPLGVFISLLATGFSHVQAQEVSASGSASFTVRRVVAIPDDGGRFQFEKLRSEGTRSLEDFPDGLKDVPDPGYESGENSHQTTWKSEMTRLSARLRNALAERGLVSVEDETSSGLRRKGPDDSQNKVFVFVNN